MEENEPMGLTDDQKSYIRANFKNGCDLKKIVSEVFPVPEGEKPTDVRSVSGRLVRSFLVAEGFAYKTARTPNSALIILTKGQEEIIREMLSRGKKSSEIANEVFKKEIKPLSVEHHVVMNYIKTNGKGMKAEDDTLAISGDNKKYFGPKSTGPVISKINNYAGAELDEKTLSRMDLTCVEKTMANLNNSRFVTIINNYNKQSDRDLYEQEFLRMTWNKPDLTPEELNQYMNLCRDMISLEAMNRHMQTLNEMFEESEKAELTVKLSDMIKSKSGELNETSKRIEASITRLQGDRQKRITAQSGQSSNFLNIVKAFQEEDERKRMLKMAALQKMLVSEEADRLESMDAMKARILGMTKETLI